MSARTAAGGAPVGACAGQRMWTRHACVRSPWTEARALLLWYGIPVLYQNAQSQAYFGDLRGQAANVILGLLLCGSNNGSDPAGAGGTWIPSVAKPMLEQALEAVSCGQSFSTVVQLPARLRLDVGEVGPVNTPGRGGETSWWVAGVSTSLQPSQGGGEDSRGLPSVGEHSSRLRSPVVDHVDRLLLAALESSDGGGGFGNNRGGGSPGLARRMHLPPQGPAKSSPNSYIFQTQQIVRHVGMQDKLLATTVAGSGGRGERVSGSGSQGHFPPRWDFVPERRSNQDVFDCEDVGQATTPHKRISYLQDANVSGGGSVRNCGGGGDNADGNSALRPELMPQDGTSHHSEAEGDAGSAPLAKVDPCPTTQPMSLMKFVSTGSKDCMQTLRSLPANYRPGVHSMTDATPDFQNSLGNYSFTAQGQQCGVSRWLQNNILAPVVPPAGAAAVSSVGSSSVPAYAQGPPPFLPALSREPGRGLVPPSSGCTTPLHAAAPTLNTLQRLLGAAATSRKRAPLRRTVSVLPRPSGTSGPSLAKATNLSPFQKLDEGLTHGFGIFGGAGSSASPVNTAPATLAPSAPVIPPTALQSLAVSSPTVPAAVAATVATASGAAHSAVATGSGTVVGGSPEAVAPVGCGIVGAGASGVPQRAISTPHSTKLSAAPARRTRSILAPKVPVQPLSTLGRSTADDVLASAARAVSIDFMRPGSFLDDVAPPNCGNGPGHSKGTNADGDDGIGHHKRQCCAAENSEAPESCVEDSCIVGTIPVTPANAAVPVGDNGMSHPPPVVPRRGWIRGVSGGAARAAGLSALLFAQGSTVGYCTVDSGKAHEAGSTASGAAGPDGALLSSSASILTATLMSEFGSTDGNAMVGYARDGGGGEAGAAAIAAGNASGSRSCHDAMPEASLGLWRPVTTGEPSFRSPPAAAIGSITDRAWTCLPTCGSNGESKLHPPAPVLLFHGDKAVNTGGKNSSRFGGREGSASFPAVLAPATELVNAPTPDAAAAAAAAAADANNNAEEQAAAATVAPAAAPLPPLSHAAAAVDGPIRIGTIIPGSINGTNVLPQTASIAVMPLLQGPAADSLVPRRCASSTSILHVNHAYPNLSPRPSLDIVTQHGRQHDHPDPHQQRQLLPSPSSSPPPQQQQQPQLTMKQSSLQRQNRKPPQRTNTHARLRQLMSNLSNEPRSQQHSQFSSGDQHSSQAPSSPAHSRRLNRILLPGDNGGGSGANRRQSSQQTFSRLSTFDETQGVPLDAATAASPAYASLLPPGLAAGAAGGGTLAQLRRTGLSAAVHKMSVCDKSVGSVAGFVAGPGWAMQACAAAGNGAMEGAVWHRVQIRAVKERRGEQGAAGLDGRADVVVATTSGAGADDNGVSQLLVVTQVDVTEHLLEYQPMARLLQKEHKVLESIFPRHCIEYLTQATGCPSGTSETPLRAPSGSTAAGDGSFGFPIASAAAAAAAAAAGGDPTAAMPLVSYGDSAARLASLATAHSCITILFCDIVGFTEMCHSASPFTVMSFLNDLYSRFDSLVDIYKVYKVETIGDCYMVAGGLVTYDEDGYKSVICNTEDPLHAVRTMEFAKAVLRASREVRMPHNGQQVKLRVGLHSGPITSGVVGERMPRFCLFGDTVNVASRMESTCRPGCIHVSSTTRDRLPSEPWRDLGMTAVKGKGSMRTFEWGGDVEEPVQSDQLQRLLGLYL
ncbi:hypothetical protein Vretimale_8153 [Volvox reticuliferus]|uniref:Guanylate cyclase domain-containing protein n=1 Tax=Volvox reticuliferus TaxID=1737510 RepID=A0A8J4LME5_9CHLO|nr:hypothetical protein Vretimale_8153 [Volvox reticuliferus]